MPQNKPIDYLKKLDEIDQRLSDAITDEHIDNYAPYRTKGETILMGMYDDLYPMLRALIRERDELQKKLKEENLINEKAIDYVIDTYDEKLGVLMKNNLKLGKEYDKLLKERDILLKEEKCHVCGKSVMQLDVCVDCFFDGGGIG